MPNPHSGHHKSHSPPLVMYTDPPQTQTKSSLLNHLYQEAERLQNCHALSSPPGTPSLQFYERVQAQGKQLEEIYLFFATQLEVESTHSQAAEWLLDNYYVLQQTVRQIEESLPLPYYKEMPPLAAPQPYTGLPRTYVMAREFLQIEQFRLDIQHLKQFILVYQEKTPLTIGETWALPIWLRIVLLEGLIQVAGPLITPARIQQPLQPGLLLDISPEEDAEKIISFCILSLRLLAGQNWSSFFEEVSQVEQTLRRDPAGVYGQMLFETRDQYRKAVEKLARYSSCSEAAVATAAIDLAQAQSTHVGFFLIGNGRSHLEQRLKYQLPGHKQILRRLAQRPTLLYLGSIAMVVLLIEGIILWYANTQQAPGPMLALIFLLSLLPAMASAVTWVNWLFTQFSQPHVLPKMDFSEGIDPSCRTMIVIPCLFTSSEEVDSLLQQLEHHYLRNNDPQLGFALLSDFADAHTATTTEDSPLLTQALNGIRQLNDTYGQCPFYLFHRRRQWNPQEGCWMGWERKRGKLQEFNRLLRGAKDTTFILQEGEQGWLTAVRYVITLDADTILPLDAAARLIGTLAHPLNVAQFDENGTRVISGYTILQPRTEVQPTGRFVSIFTRVFAGDTGLDLYTLAVSDIYQDLFGEGSYTGKGIYEIDAFERSLAGRVPENSLLSHDLFEGIQGRAGLVTDVILYEDYPAHYLTYLRRSHRWIRGDWQLLPWLLPRVPTANGLRPNDLRPIHLWKIGDNLRRSLQAPAYFLFFLAAWLLLPGSLLVWTSIGLLLSATTVITRLITILWENMTDPSWREAGRQLRHSIVRWLLHIAFLPYETILVVDAVLVTLWRLLISRRNLLRWTTSAHTARLIGPKISTKDTLLHAQSLPAIVLSLGVAILILLENPAAIPVTAPLVLTWLLSFVLAHRISQPPVEKSGSALTAAQQQQLRKLARATWLFFEQYVTPADNWLPPDHFQEFPRGIVAHRTSPTNIGLYLLSALSARDLGYISVISLSLRLRATFTTLAQMSRYRGHFLNWIDTTTLHPLPPRYVSTVDSGNLAGCLLALKQGCRNIGQEPVWSWERWQGLIALLQLFADYIEATAVDGKPLLSEINQLATTILDHQQRPADWGALIIQVAETHLPHMEQCLLDLKAQHPSPETVYHWRVYIERLRRNISGMQRELSHLLPWLLVWPPPLAHHTHPSVQKAFHRLQELLIPASLEETMPSLSELPALCRQARAQLETLAKLPETDEDTAAWCHQLNQQLAESQLMAESLLTAYEELAREAHRYAHEMDFSFLYNQQRQVFHIGYNLESDQLDNNFYDLLASEARIASLVAIAKRDVPSSHWLHLARPLTQSRGGLTLLSWSGTMFEYLMPPLLMRSLSGTLLHESYRAVVRHQIAYGQEQQIPWGISESGYYAFDSDQNYQYRAFGVPGLGFERGLGDDRVISPYASLLALPIQPQAVMSNLANLQEYKMQGIFGLYEALDFTPARLEVGQDLARIRSYMSHHQGMILVTLLNFLQHNKMVARFHGNPVIQSVELLLQEQIPTRPPLEDPQGDESLPETGPKASSITAVPWQIPGESDVPLVHWLSNGRFHTLISNAGSGQVQGNNIVYTRWQPDTTQDNWGTWIYVQDLDNNHFWSAGLQPVGGPFSRYEVHYFPHMARFRRHDQEIGLQTEIAVDPQADVEVRRLTLTNQTDRLRRLRLTSYGEVVLSDAATDRRHPTFAKLFVESEYVAEVNALFFRRRPQTATESPLFLAHMLVVGEGDDTTLTRAYESDRAAFLGRGKTVRSPQALTSEQWLTGTTGATLDPVMALGQTVTLEAHSTTQLAFVTATAETRADLLALCQRYQHWTILNRAFSTARHQAEQDLRRLELPVAELSQAQQVLSRLLYPSLDLRSRPSTLAENVQGQAALWAYGISGDHPILLVKIHDESGGPLLQTILRAHTYWRRRGLKIDLVILNQQESSDGQPLHGFIQRLIHHQDSDHWLNRHGGLVILQEDQMSKADQILLQTAARVVLDGRNGTLSTQLESIGGRPYPLPYFLPTTADNPPQAPTAPLSPPTALQFQNGCGDFSGDGREYLPVADMPAEALYIRDEETAVFWSPMPQPCPAAAPYTVHHGAGYSRFQHVSHDLKQETTLFIAPNAPVKIVRLKVENQAQQPRRLTLTYYAEWTLGTDRTVMQLYVQPWYRQDYHALLAKNPYTPDSGGRVTFLATDKSPHGYTTDRTSFLGRLGTLQQPDALFRIGLDNRVQSGLDPCAAIQVHLSLEPGESQTATFLLGQTEDEKTALSLIGSFRQPQRLTQAWQENETNWDPI